MHTVANTYLTDDEYYDDDDEYKGDVVILLLTETLHLGPLTFEGLEDTDEAVVEEREAYEGEGEHEHSVHHVVVDDVVEVRVLYI